MSNETRALFERLRGTERVSGFDYDTCAESYAYTLPENALTFDSLAHVKRALKDAGSHYFDAGAIRFFLAKTHKAANGVDLWDGRFWVESKQFEASDGTREPRTYSVAWVSRYPANGTLSVEKLGEVDNLPAARKYAKLLAESVREALDNEA